MESTYNTRHKSLKQEPFFLNFLQISYIHSWHLCSHLNLALSFSNVEPRVFWSSEMTVIPKSTLRNEKKSHKCFKICDEYCRLKPFWSKTWAYCFSTLFRFVQCRDLWNLYRSDQISQICTDLAHPIGKSDWLHIWCHSRVSVPYPFWTMSIRIIYVFF